MRKLYLFAAMAAMLASCSSDDLTKEQAAVQQTTDEAAVSFDVYVNRGLTRGGVNGDITTNKLKGDPDATDASKAGFGVFGYYTDGEPYSAITKPNFFYNQQVKYEGGVWTYSPLKYWPNEFGGDAKSDQVDRVTLFAYLPWVDVDPLTGVVKSPTSTELSGLTDEAAAKLKNQKDPTTNIIGMTRNTATGDPFIKYVATMDPTNSVDLCYGVAAARFTSSNSAINQNDIEEGMPYIDVKKPGTDANSKIKFDFKHATAQINVTIDADVKDMTTGSTDVQTNFTRIWVRSVTFTGITQKGALSLNSQKNIPEWYDINGTSKITTGSLTVYDGRKDGKEANDAANNETPATLNAQIVQAKQYSLNKTTGVIEAPTETGVVKTRYNLFNTTDVNAPVFVIPTREKMRVTIVYDVETVDKNLPYYLSDGKTAGTTIQNTIYKDIDTFGEIVAGNHYTLNLHLGMRTVDFDAEVTPWQNYGADVDLPSNLQTFAAANTAPTPHPTVILPAGGATNFQFAVSGLKINSTPDVSSFTIDSDDISSSVTATPVNSAGITIVTISSIDANNTIDNLSGEWTVSDTEGNSVIIDVTQQAAALGMSIKSVSGKVVTLEKATSLTSTWDDAVLTSSAIDAKKIKVWRNGQVMTVISGEPNESQVKYTNDGKLTFKNDFIPGDVITAWIQAGDATEESVTANIAGAKFARTYMTHSGKKGTKIQAQELTIIGQGTLSGWSFAAGTGDDVVDNMDSSTGELTLKNATGSLPGTIGVNFMPAKGYYLSNGKTNDNYYYNTTITSTE